MRPLYVATLRRSAASLPSRRALTVAACHASRLPGRFEHAGCEVQVVVVLPGVDVDRVEAHRAGVEAAHIAVEGHGAVLSALMAKARAHLVGGEDVVHQGWERPPRTSRGEARQHAEEGIGLRWSRPSSARRLWHLWPRRRE